jgi:hypothetical protein
VFQTTGLVVLYGELVQTAVDGLYTQSWYSLLGAPPVTATLKLTLVPAILGLAGVARSL